MVFLLDLLQHSALHGVNLLYYVEHLVVAHLEVALVAHQKFCFVVLGEAALVLTTAVAHCAGTPLAMMPAFPHDPSEFFGKRLLARETLLGILKFQLVLELFREPIIALFILPHLVGLGLPRSTVTRHQVVLPDGH